MAIHKSIKSGSIFFKSHYMVPAAHFDSHFDQSEMKIDFTKEQIDQLKQMPFIEVNDYKCFSRRARTSGSFFPSLDRPILEAAGFMFSLKQHLPFYRPHNLSSWNPMEQVGSSYRAEKESRGQYGHFPYLRNTIKVPHAIGIKVDNRNLFFETLSKARIQHAREVMYHLIRQVDRTAIESFLERFAPLAKISAFYDLFAETNAFLQHEGMENHMRRFLFNTYLGSNNTNNVHHINKMNGKLEHLASFEEITVEDYTDSLQDGVFGKLSESLQNNRMRFYQVNIDVDARQVIGSYQGRTTWDRDNVALFYMIYLRYHHALFIKKHSVFDTFVSLYSQAVGQRLKDESKTNAPLFSALSKKLSNEQLLHHHYLQNTLPDDYVHPLFNPGFVHGRVEDYNERYIRSSRPLLVMFAKTYFAVGSEETVFEDMTNDRMSFTFKCYPGYNYDSYSFRLHSPMKRSIFLRNPKYELVDDLLHDLMPPPTFDGHVPFEVFRHKSPAQSSWGPPQQLATNFELT